VRALVAGGAGFVGSHLCEALLNRGWDVVCLDNLCTGGLANIRHLTSNQAFEFLEADVTCPPDVPAALILHFASPASPVVYQRIPVETMLANSMGTLRLLELAQRYDARFLFASTSEVYGDPLEHPQVESYRGNVDSTGPRACYDEAKRFGETLTLEMSRRHGLSCAIVRIFNTYGPRMGLADGRAIPAFFEAGLHGRPLPIQGDGSQTRSFCYVSDLIDGILTVALDSSSTGEVFNLGNPYEVSILEVARMVADVVGAEPAFEYLPAAAQDPVRRRPNITKIDSRYGWQPRVSLEEGLARTADYFRAVISHPAAV
jgi:UDP-glucuronate decarboxylase